MRVDTGGALLFRARGERKGNAFDARVSELQSLRDRGLNASSYDIFAGMTPTQLAHSISLVLAIRPEDIDAAVDAVGFPSYVAEPLKALLKQRRATLASFSVPRA